MRDVKTRIVIVGGGSAGVCAAMHLDKTVARRSEAEVMLISRENFMLFTPMLHEVAAGDLHPSDIVNPLRRILRHVRVVAAEVDAIDLGARRVTCVAGMGRVRVDEYLAVPGVRQRARGTRHVEMLSDRLARLRTKARSHRDARILELDEGTSVGPGVGLD